MIKFACPNCRESIRVDDKYAGKRGKCPKCGNAVRVPKRSTSITFACEGCGHTIKVPERYAGKQGKCPKCQIQVVVPALQDLSNKERGDAARITCSVCDQVIDVAEDVAEGSLECPGCGSTLDVSSGRPVSGVEDEKSDDTDENLYEASAAYETSSGPDRRLVLIIAGVAVVVVAGIIGLVIFLRSSGPEPAREPAVAYRSPATAETESQPQALVADEPQPGTTAALETGDGIRLQFRPTPGEKRTLRVSTHMDMSIEQGGQQHRGTSTQTITVDIETGESTADGTIGVGITLTQIQQKSETDGIGTGTYDSAEAVGEDDILAKIYGSFVGKPFTIGVSGQGNIIDHGLDELFLAVAKDRMQAEDWMMRKRLKEKADAAIDRMDQRFGSRQARALDLKKQLEESPAFGTGEIRDLLAHLVVSLPEQSVQMGAGWNGSLAVSEGSGMPVDMPATYTMTAIEEDTCKISAQGKRDINEEPIVSQTGQVTVSSKLAGSSQADLTVDRRTGWLMRKDQTTRLSGQMQTSPSRPQGSESAMQVNMEITTTVEPVVAYRSPATAETESPPQALVADEPEPETTAPLETGDGIRLQFRPTPGEKRTLRLITHMDVSIEQGGQQQQITSTETITVDLETGESTADGTIGVGITLTQIQQKGEGGGTETGTYTYDSAEDAGEDDIFSETYRSFVGKRFTIGVSGQGNIMDFGLDELFLAVAEDRMQAEDWTTRIRLKEKADAAIERRNQRFGSRRARVLALKKQLEEFPIFGTEKIRDLLAHLFVTLPEQSVQMGAAWTGSLAVREGSGMPATYTMTAIEEDTCRISAQGKREANEEPIVSQAGQATGSSKLPGSSQADLTVDRRTGWLMHKDQTTRLSGQQANPAGPQGSEAAMQVDMEITTTVEPVL